MTKEKLIEKFNEKFPPREADGSNYAYSLMSNEEVKSFLLESINEILDEVEPKEVEETHSKDCEYQRTGCDCGYENRCAYNHAITDLKDNRKKLGY